MSRGGSGLRQSPSLVNSLSEIAFLLAFIFIASSGVLGVFLQRLGAKHDVLKAAHKEVVEENLLLEEESFSLRESVASLEAELEKIRNANLPCWRRPDGTIPAIAGRIHIYSTFEFEVWHFQNGSQRFEVLPGESEVETLREVLNRMFVETYAYARQNNCYLRIEIVNHTFSYDIYATVEDLVTAMGLVIAR